MKIRFASAASLAANLAAAMLGMSCAAADAQSPVPPTGIAPLVAPDLRWNLRLPQEEKVVYRGVVSFDGAGVGNLNMLYPAPNVAVGLIAVLTHGLMNEVTKKSQKARIQDAADSVLLPYKEVLNNYTYRELMQRGLEKSVTGGTRTLVAFSQKAGAEWFVESTPVFALTQDQSALIVENMILIYPPGAAPPVSFEHLVKVVSSVKNTPDLVTFWTADDGRNIKEESAGLLAESLDIALREAVNGPGKGNEAFKTIRYREGNAEKMERGQQIGEYCNRVVIRTLRGGLMSVPTDNKMVSGESAKSCDDAQAIAN